MRYVLRVMGGVDGGSATFCCVDCDEAAVVAVSSARMDDGLGLVVHGAIVD